MHAMTASLNAYDRKNAGGAFPRSIFATRVSKKLPRGHTFPHQNRPLKIETTTGATMHTTAKSAILKSKSPTTKNANKKTNENFFHTRAKSPTATLLVFRT
jgi:hypothetical protein